MTNRNSLTVSSHAVLSRVLVVDDVFGRNTRAGRNEERENLCAQFLWQDVTGDDAARLSPQKVLEPTAEVVFCRAQKPACATVGDTVENDLEAALDAIRSGWPAAKSATGNQPLVPWSMVLLDLCFYTGLVSDGSERQTPGMPEGRPGDDDPARYFGLTLLDAIHREFSELPVMILSSKPREDVSLEFSQRGAMGFIARDDLRGPELLQDALWQHGLLPDAAGEVIGNSLPVLLTLREARRAARHGQNVLIRGERGTGKELLARYLHRVTGDPAKRPFVPVNSAVFTQSLFASELFGIEDKTATGVAARTGLIQTANGGDLFFDEIADMPPEVQASVLRVLQERQIIGVGKRKHVAVDVRFLSATNVEIESGDGGFRADLLDRLRMGGSLWLPPLRERKADIPLMVEAFVRAAEKKRSGTMRREVTSEALAQLAAYDWPGNIRELQTCISDAVNRHPDVEHLVPAHLRFEAKEKEGGRTPTEDPKSQKSKKISRPLVSDDLASLLNAIAQCEFPAPDVGKWAGQLDDLQREHARLLARYLQAALDATKRRTPAAPEGQIQIHPAVKLITGDSALTASKAADIVKRLLMPLKSELQGDLAGVYQTAVRLRPKSSRKLRPMPS